MPLGKPWLYKPDTKIKTLSLCPHCNCMTKTIYGACGKCKDTKMKTDWEDVKAAIEFAKKDYALLVVKKYIQEQEEQHKKEIKEVNQIGYNAGFNEGRRNRLQEAQDSIDFLKQQHRAHITKIKNFITNKMWLSDTYKCYLIDAEKVIEKLDQMLQDSDTCGCECHNPESAERENCEHCVPYLYPEEDKLQDSDK